jgi:hypothetical protein
MCVPLSMHRGRGQLQWLRRQAGSRIRRIIIGRLYRDRFPDYHRTVIVAGVARSGTTWLGDIISSQGRNRILFEPFNPYPVGALKTSIYIRYRRQGDQDPTLLDYCERLFSGRIRNAWIDQQVEHIYPEYRVVKSVRANLMLKWLCCNFPQIPIVLIIRHPYAVVSSWLKLGWTAQRDWSSFLSQPDLVHDFLAERSALVEQLVWPEERIAAAWCINHLVPFAQLDSGDVHIVFYEDLVTNPEREIPRLFKALGRSYDESIFRTLLKPSLTSRWQSAATTGNDSLAQWKKSLSRVQIERIRATVADFGLAHLYGEDATPRSKPVMAGSECLMLAAQK